MRLPQNTIWKQSNISDRFGDIYSSYNLDLTTNLGNLRLFPRMLLNTNSTTETNLGVPAAFRSFSCSATDSVGLATMYQWAVAGSRVFCSRGGPETPFRECLTLSTPTSFNSDQSDIEEFNNCLYFSGASTSLFKLNSSGTWSTLTSKVNNSSGNHAMVYFRPQNRLYFVDDNAASIGSINTSDTIATLGQQYTLQNLVSGSGSTVGEAISWIDANDTYIFIGIISYTGSQSKIYFWNGSTANVPDGYFLIDANGTLSCVIKDNVPVVVDTKGGLLQLNGGTFVELDRLPFENSTPISYFNNATGRLCHYNGMEIIDGEIHILFNTQLWDTNSTLKERIPSGVWGYTKETGLYHKGGLGYSTASGTIKDYGQQRISKVGALQEVDTPNVNITQGSINGKFLVGATIYTDATTTLKGIFYDDTADTVQKAGYFVTPKLFSNNIDDIKQKLFLRIKKISSGDEIVIKYRTEDVDPLNISITTWSSSSSVRTSTSITNYAAGDEIEFLQGEGSGRCFKIVSITDIGGGVSDIVIDGSITNLTGVSGKARLQHWKQLGEKFTSTTTDIIDKSLLNIKNSAWVQFKITILNTGNSYIYDLNCVTTNNQKQ